MNLYPMDTHLIAQEPRRGLSDQSGTFHLKRRRKETLARMASVRRHTPLETPPSSMTERRTRMMWALRAPVTVAPLTVVAAPARNERNSQRWCTASVGRQPWNTERSPKSAVVPHPVRRRIVRTRRKKVIQTVTVRSFLQESSLEVVQCWIPTKVTLPKNYLAQEHAPQEIKANALVTI